MLEHERLLKILDVQEASDAITQALVNIARGRDGQALSYIKGCISTLHRVMAQMAEKDWDKAVPEGPPNEQVHSDGTVYTKTVKK